MMVCANFMKSYALEPAAFAEKAALSEKYGAEVLYLVDSAGGMLPDDVGAYFKAVRDTCGIALGFHGHDNLGLSVANTLRAVEQGAAIVDSSLQGFGRSAGNAPTEILVVALKRMGIETGINYYAAMDAGEKYIRPLVRRRGHSSLDVITGLAQFHSSYMGLIRKYSSRYGVDPRRLIESLCLVDKVNAPAELVERLARELKTDAGEVFTARFDFDEYFGSEQSGGKGTR